MKMVLRLLKDYKKESILAPLFKMLEAIFELFVPLVMASLIDRGIRTADMRHIWVCGLLLLALAAIGLTSAVTAQYFSAKAAIGAAAKLRHELFAHLQKLSFSRIDELGTDTMITRMTSDVNQVQNGINMVLRLFLRSPFIVFGAMIMAFTIDVRAAFIFVVTIPMLAAVVYGIMFITMPMYRRVQEALDSVLGRTRENLTGVRVIRAFAAEESEISGFNSQNGRLYDLQMSVGRISALTNPVTFIIVNAATLVLLYTGAVRVDEAVITQGELVALVNYMSQILVELVKLANLIVTITKALACAARIESVLDTNEGMADGDLTEAAFSDSPDVPRVEFEDVSLSYGGGEEALSEISFKAGRGETIGIIGGTGSGKSTLVNLIPRFYDASRGIVRVDGADVRSLHIETLRSRIGIVLQKAALFSGTVAENLRWGNEHASDEELIEALKLAQAWEFVQAKEGVLEAEISQGGKNLSGGQRQRLCIARALVKKPDILILDDSASALDYATDAALRHGISSMVASIELNNRPTVFIVSQRTASIQHADRIIVLDDGRAVDIGTHEELLSRCGIYREIHESQFKDTGKEA